MYFKQAIFYRLIWIENQFFFQFAVFLCAYILRKREQNITKASQTTKWKFTIETISCVQVSLSWTHNSKCFVHSVKVTYSFVVQFNWSTLSEISEYVSRAETSWDKKFVDSPTLSERKMKSRKRKMESEPIFLRKKVRLLNRVSDNGFHWKIDS